MRGDEKDDEVVRGAAGTIMGCMLASRGIERLTLAFFRTFPNAPLGWRVRHEFPSLLRRSGSSERWIRVRPGTKMLVDAGDIYGHAYVSGADYEPSTTTFVESHLSRGETFVDIGANQGWFSMLAAHVVGVAGKVIAFEPNPAMCSYLNRSVLRNAMGTRVTVEDIGLGDHDEVRPLFLSRHQNNDGMSSFIPQWAGHSGGSGETSRDVIQVSCRTFDSWVSEHPLDRVDMVKIDTEGWEINILKGMEQALQRLRPKHIICETNADSQVAIFLKKLGYLPHTIPDSLNVAFTATMIR